MPDIRLVQSTLFPNYDVTVDWLLLSNGTLDDTQALATAVIVALGTDALAAPSDILPIPGSTDRRGWWGDLDAEELWGGWPIGSKLWLLTRSKITGSKARQGSTIAAVENYITAAIQPFITNGIASAMSVKAWQPRPQQINAMVRVYRGPKSAIELQFEILWDEIIALSTPGNPSPYTT